MILRATKLLAIVLFACSYQFNAAMMRAAKEDHHKCGCPAISQRQPRSAGRSGQKLTASAASAAAATTGRIFNGRPSKRGSWPWQVSLQLLHPKMGFIGHWCGGVLIHQSWILTAAHCIHNELFNLPIGALWTVVVGEWELDSGSRGSARLAVERVILHDRFNNYINDIALMKLARPAPLSRTVRTICLPESSRLDAEAEAEADECSFVGLHCVTSGWGRSGPSSQSLSNTLLEATVPVLELQHCHKAYGASVPILDGHLCAGYSDGSSGSCVGDSGGPLQCRRADGIWQLAGVTSFGSGCDMPGHMKYDVYTNVASYIKWIRDTIANDDRDS